MSESTSGISDDLQEQSGPSIEEIAEMARELFQEIVDGMGVDAIVDIASIDDTDITLDAEGGDDGGVLIGRHGQTLEAVQLLVATIMGRYTTRRIRIFLDAFGYRQRRAEALRQMAREVAEQVCSSGQEALTEPLNAADRRIIHTALYDMEGISTYSEGTEPHRYVVITPKDDE